MAQNGARPSLLLFQAIDGKVAIASRRRAPQHTNHFSLRLATKRAVG